MGKISLVDTHCHIHEPKYKFDVSFEVDEAKKSGVDKLIFVGTDVESSRDAVKEANRYDGCFVALGVHPHEAEQFLTDNDISELEGLVGDGKVIAIGEIGLDYFYEHSNREAQAKVLKLQLRLAEENNLPVIFHARGSRNDPDDVFEDLWPILDEFPGIKKAVMHSFTASSEALKQVIERGFLVGVNGIMTFSKDSDHNDIARTIDLKHVILETDAPYLTPKPFRGTINQPKNVRLVAEFLSEHRGETLEEIASATTKNAENLFNI